MSKKPNLVSFKLCPFVQRSVIALLEKQVDFDITHIQLDDPPDWFKAISPLGKVPVLLVDDKAIFESAVILEYLDEVYPPQLHPADPLIKAQHRSWIEYCSELIMSQHKLFTSENEEKLDEQKQKFTRSLNRLANILDQTGPYFSGKNFALVDATYAPLFMRLAVVQRQREFQIDMEPRLQAWSDALLDRPCVQQSVVADFETLFIRFMEKQGGYLFL